MQQALTWEQTGAHNAHLATGRRGWYLVYKRNRKYVVWFHADNRTGEKIGEDVDLEFAQKIAKDYDD